MGLNTYSSVRAIPQGSELQSCCQIAMNSIFLVLRAAPLQHLPPMQPSSADEDFNLRKHTGCCGRVEATHKKNKPYTVRLLRCRARERRAAIIHPSSPAVPTELLM